MKDKIAKACTQLLWTHNLDEISVRDITELCGVSRQSFYYYFENIESAAAYAFDVGFDALKESCIELHDPREVLGIIVRGYAKQYILLQHLMQSKSKVRVKRYYYRVLYDVIRTQFNHFNVRPDLEPGELDLDVSFFAYGIGGLLYERCAEPDVDPDKLADEIYRYIGERIAPVFVR